MARKQDPAPEPMDEELAEQLLDRARRVAQRKLIASDAADDIAQSAMLQMHEGKKRPDLKLIVTIARRLASNFNRALGRSREVRLVDDIPQEPREDLWTELQQLLLRMNDATPIEMTPLQSSVAEAIREGMSKAEVARRLKVSRRQIDNALKEIGQMLMDATDST